MVETKGKRTRGTSSLVREHFSLSHSLGAHVCGEEEARPKDERSFARSETKLVAFRGTRDGADRGDGGTAGQKRITRVITTLINKWASRRENLPSNRAWEADARRSYLRPTSRGPHEDARSLSGPLLSFSRMRLSSIKFLLLPHCLFSFCVSLSPPLLLRLVLLRIQNATCTLRCEDNGALKHALLPLPWEFHVISHLMRITNFAIAKKI